MIKYWISVIFIICTFVNSCSLENTPTEIVNISEDVIEVASVEPDSPAVLNSGQKFNIHILYELNSIDSAAIWVRPYNNGKRARNYHVHHLIQIGAKGEKEGVVTGWFFFDNAAEVDELRVFLKDVKANKILKEISYPVNIKWIGPTKGDGVTKTKGGCSAHKKIRSESKSITIKRGN